MQCLESAYGRRHALPVLRPCALRTQQGCIVHATAAGLLPRYVQACGRSTQALVSYCSHCLASMLSRRFVFCQALRASMRRPSHRHWSRLFSLSCRFLFCQDVELRTEAGLASFRLSCPTATLRHHAAFAEPFRVLHDSFHFNRFYLLKCVRLAFSFVWVGEHVFIPFFAPWKSSVICQRKRSGLRGHA